MKKLIINQKNLPKISKPTDSNIRIRINKTQNTPDLILHKKSTSFQLQHIDDCLQVLDRFLNNKGTIEQQMFQQIVHILKAYKQLLMPNQDLMTQSLKFSKLKLKTVNQSEDKQNCNFMIKGQKNIKQIPASDRINRILQKQNSVNKSPKVRKFMSTHKKGSDQMKDVEQNDNQNVKQQKTQDIQENSGLKMKRYSETVKVKQQNEKTELKGNGQYDEVEHNQQESMVVDKIENRFVTENQQKTNGQCPQLMEQTKFGLQTHSTYIQGYHQTINLNQQLQRKISQVQQLHQRIQQLNANIQNLVKKNITKAEQFNKLQQQLLETKQKYTEMQILYSQAKPKHDDLLKCNHQLKKQLSELNVQLKQTKLQLEQKEKQISKSMLIIQKLNNRLEEQDETKNDNEKCKIEEELGRYQTAQQFYELTRNDLKRENEHLMGIIKERQSELLNIYHTFSVQRQSQLRMISA